MAVRAHAPRVESLGPVVIAFDGNVDFVRSRLRDSIIACFLVGGGVGGIAVHIGPSPIGVVVGLASGALLGGLLPMILLRHYASARVEIREGGVRIVRERLGNIDQVFRDGDVTKAELCEGRHGLLRRDGRWLRLHCVDGKKPVELTEFVYDEHFDAIVDELKKHVEIALVRVF